MMLYRVKASKALHPSDPLHVSRIYQKERVHRKMQSERQGLILYLASLHRQAVADKRVPLAFQTVQVSLTDLREWVYDFRPALDHFFEVKQLGFNIRGVATEISTLTPKKLPTRELQQEVQFTYEPPERPDDGVVSKVHVLQRNGPAIIEKLRAEKRFDLIPPTEWLLQYPEVNFIFKTAGKLKQRDTSVWPVRCIENWPSWLREDLFGQGIDIDSAYAQYLVQCLKQIYADRPALLRKLFPDLLAQVEDKLTWRKELAAVLGVTWDDPGIRLIKQVCMSIANGSRVSPNILVNGRGFSVTAQLVVDTQEFIDYDTVQRIGSRLQSICRQYTSAKNVICSAKLGISASRTNKKRVFADYFTWEREARYRMWEAVDRHGIMMHDGIDGIPSEYVARLDELIEKVGVALST